MITLLKKDFRLAMDMLLPWGMIVAGFAAGMGVLLSVPEHLRGDLFTRFRWEDLCGVLALVVGLAAVGTAAWCAAAVTLGERRHGAWLYELSAPIAASARIGSKAMVLLLVVGLHAGLVVLLVLAPVRADVWGAPSAPPDGGSVFPWWAGLTTALAALCGVGLALTVASIVRTIFGAVLVALLCGMTGVGLGIAASWVALRWFLGSSGVRFDDEWTLLLVARELRTIGGVAGALATGLACLGGGLWILAKPRSATCRVGVVVGSLVLAFVAGLVTARAAARSVTATNSPRALARGDAEALSSAELAAEVGRIAANRRAWHGSRGPLDLWTPSGFPWLTLDDDAILEVARQRAAAIGESERATDPLAVELRSVLDSSSAEMAQTDHLFRIRGDPSGIRALMESTVKFPENANVRRQLLFELLHRDPRRADAEVWRSSERVDRALREAIENLRDRDPDFGELAAHVLEVLDESASGDDAER